MGLTVFESELFAKQRREAQKAAVVFVGCDQLQAGVGRWEDDCGIPPETGRSGKTQDACA